MPFEEELLDLARKGADEAEVYALTYEETPVSFEANRLKSILTRQSRGVALRIIKGGRIGFAAGAGPERPQELLEIALETAQFGAEARFHLPPPGAYATVEVYDPALEQVTVESMVQAGQSAIDRIVAHTPGILCEGSLVKRTSTLRLLNSAGASLSSRKTVFSARLEGTLVRGTEMLFVGDAQASCRPALDLSPLVAETIQQLELTREVAPAPQGEVPVIFTPKGVAQAFALPLSMGLSGKNVLQGSSPLADLLGQQRFDPRFSLTDDPLTPFAPGSRPFDDEGVPCRPLPLIQAGVPRGFLYDLQTAGMAGLASTGSATRALTTLPAPGLSVMVVSPGDVSYVDLVAGVSEGLVVEEMLGASQGNVLGGDFSGNVLLGYKIQGGRLVGRVKDTMVAGNVYALLKELRGISREARWVGGSLLTPAIACQKVFVSTKA
ncbi:MAG: TldD/PmbA family protein [Chloroflexi bacterium]|nr:TldD/PmbA family protein [Chloroflexota bacterium]